MFNIAIILFPGLNTEAETKRAIEQVGMSTSYFRWNEPADKLRKFDGYVIGGGFAYEDRGRAGLIAAKDPIMKVIKEQAERGKPVLGICNGAQILVESGLIPGDEDKTVAMCVAKNKRIKNNHVLGLGYYNTWVHFKSTVPQKRCAFTYAIPEGSVFRAPIAHGEGRFVTAHATLFPQLIENRQIVFRYCDKKGTVKDEFPINPNGASFNTAAICNPAGNVMAIMPHGERGFVAPLPEIFHSMKAYIFDQKKPTYLTTTLKLQQVKDLPTSSYNHPNNSIEILSELIITDNETETIQACARRLGFSEIKLKKYTHFEIKLGSDYNSNELKKIIQSGEIANTNKEIVYVKNKNSELRYDQSQKNLIEQKWPIPEGNEVLFIREKEDFIGQSVTETLTKALSGLEVQVAKSTIWVVSGHKNDQEFNDLCQTYLLYSPHSHQFLLYN